MRLLRRLGVHERNGDVMTATCPTRFVSFSGGVPDSFTDFVRTCGKPANRVFQGHIYCDECARNKRESHAAGIVIGHRLDCWSGWGAFYADQMEVRP